VVIVGGGYIACEFAGIFNGLGSRVSQVYRGEAVLRGFDQDVRLTLGAEMRQKGIDLLLQREVRSIVPSDGELRVTLDDELVLSADQVMYATGRVPNAQPGPRELRVLHPAA
jgi:glutathione reductase (NADPH)